MSESENILLRRFASTGDPEAFSKIVQRHAGLVYGACHRVLSDKDSAADAAQETFLQLLRNARTITGPVPVWLHRVATRKSIDIVRRDSSRRKREARYAAEIPQRITKWQDLSRYVDEGLDDLDAQTRETLIQHFFQGCTTNDIAAKLGVSQPTVSRRIEAGVAQLRGKLRSRGIIVSAATFLALLGENVVQAAPAVVLQELGKIALVGGQAAAATGAGVTASASGSGAKVAAGIFAGVKAKVVTAAAVTVVGVGSVLTYTHMTEPSTPPQPATTAGPARSGPLLPPPQRGEAGASKFPLGRRFGGYVAAPVDAEEAQDTSFGDDANEPRMGGMMMARAYGGAIYVKPKEPDASGEEAPEHRDKTLVGIGELGRKYAAQKPATAKALLAERVVHFPTDRSLGSLSIWDENAKWNVPGLGCWAEADDPEVDYLGQARGSVTIPAGKVLCLSVARDAWKDLSPLSNLNPDDLHTLVLHGQYQGAALPDNRCMPYIAHLTGLKVLSFENTNISAKGLQSLKHLKNLEELTLRGAKKVTNQALSQIAQLPSLRRLELQAHRITNSGLAHLARLTSLEELTLGSGPLTNAALAHLTKLPRLTYLMLNSSGFTDAGMVHLKSVPSLRILYIGHMLRLTDAALVHISKIPNLETAQFPWTENITDAGITHLKELHSLKALDIGHARITDKALADLATIDSLEYLRLPNQGLTDESLAHIAKLDKLKYLWICCSSSSPLTDQALGYVSQLKSLETLYIGGTRFTDAGMRQIAKLPNLKDLGLSPFENVTNSGLRELTALKSLKSLDISDDGARITVSGLSCLNAMPGLVELHARGIVQDNSGLDISGLTNLEELTLNLQIKGLGKSIVRDIFGDQDMACLARLKKLKHLRNINGISDVGLEHLSGLSQMVVLAVAGPNITDAGLAHLAKMPNLKSLIISDGTITDQGLIHLQSHETLEHLSITSRKRLSAAAKRSLRKHLPNLLIVHYPIQARHSR